MGEALIRKLNLGCGERFRPDWINVDHRARPPYVIGHDLLKPLPFPDNHFDFVYSSHVLEHFSQSDGARLLVEQYRVLKPGGTVRCVVPDLELLARTYLRRLEEVRANSSVANTEYQWSLLALFDQCWRNSSGGEMVSYLRSHADSELREVFALEGLEIRELYERLHDSHESRGALRPSIRGFARRLGRALRHSWRLNWLLSGIDRTRLRVGTFRLSGEVHYWMYDTHSLGTGLAKAGFVNVVQRVAHESSMPNWADEHLDTLPEGAVFKPSSLFMEAQKPG